MSRRVVAGAIAIVVLSAAAVWTWRAFFRGEDRVIRGRLEALTTEFNEETSEGLGLVARAAKIGSFFTEDVIVDLGRGTAPIEGRETLIGMAARLQPRTAAFRVTLDDVVVNVAPERGTAQVSLTATFTRREGAPAEESIDAREFTIGMKKVRGDWLIARVTAVQTLK